MVSVVHGGNRVKVLNMVETRLLMVSVGHDGNKVISVNGKCWTWNPSQHLKGILPHGLEFLMLISVPLTKFLTLIFFNVRNPQGLWGITLTGALVVPIVYSRLEIYLYYLIPFYY